jgi:hypothetical protein
MLSIEPSIVGKWLAMLKEIAPNQTKLDVAATELLKGFCRKMGERVAQWFWDLVLATGGVAVVHWLLDILHRR